MGLLFGSAGAHTYLKSGQIAPPPFRTLKLLLFRVVVFVFNKFQSFLQILNESVALFRNGSILLFL